MTFPATWEYMESRGFLYALCHSIVVLCQMTHPALNLLWAETCKSRYHFKRLPQAPKMIQIYLLQGLSIQKPFFKGYWQQLFKMWGCYCGAINNGTTISRQGVAYGREVRDRWATTRVGRRFNLSPPEKFDNSDANWFKIVPLNDAFLLSLKWHLPVANLLNFCPYQSTAATNPHLSWFFKGERQIFPHMMVKYDTKAMMSKWQPYHTKVMKETRQTCLHNLHHLYQLIHVFTSSYESLQHQYLVVFEHVAAVSTHDLRKWRNDNMNDKEKWLMLEI